MRWREKRRFSLGARLPRGVGGKSGSGGRGKWKELMEEVEGESQAQLNEEGLVRNLELYIAGKKAHPLHLGRLVRTIFLISTLF